MNKSIIFSKNFEEFKKMYNLISNSKQNFYINFFKIATNYKELLELINNFKINLIILLDSDLESPKIFSICKNIENKIILITNKNANYKNSKHCLYLHLEDNSKNDLEKLTKFLTRTNESDIRNYFRTLLKNYDFNFNLNGTTYLLEAIVYSYINKDKYIFENLEKNVFPKIAKKYHTSNKNVKWAIVRSINSLKCTHSKLKSLDDRLTPKTVITELVNLF